MKTLTDFRKTVETGVDPRLRRARLGSFSNSSDKYVGKLLYGKLDKRVPSLDECMYVGALKLP